MECSVVLILKESDRTRYGAEPASSLVFCSLVYSVVRHTSFEIDGRIMRAQMLRPRPGCRVRRDHNQVGLGRRRSTMNCRPQPGCASLHFTLGGWLGNLRPDVVPVLMSTTLWTPGTPLKRISPICWTYTCANARSNYEAFSWETLG